MRGEPRIGLIVLFNCDCVSITRQACDCRVKSEWHKVPLRGCASRQVRQWAFGQNRSLALTSPLAALVRRHKAQAATVVVEF